MSKGFKVVTVSQQTCILGAFFSIAEDCTQTRAHSIKDNMSLGRNSSWGLFAGNDT